jgi:hypothetical protein
MAPICANPSCGTEVALATSADKEVLFHVRQDPRLAHIGSLEDPADKDCLGNVSWRASPLDVKAFHNARDGEHLMALFECNYCMFSKIWR